MNNQIEEMQRQINEQGQQIKAIYKLLTSEPEKKIVNCDCYNIKENNEN